MRGKLRLGRISFYMIQSGAGGCPWPPHPGEPVPAVPPSEDTTGPPSATGACGQPPAPIIKITYLEMLSCECGELQKMIIIPIIYV